MAEKVEMLAAGGRKLPVRVGREGRKLALSFRNFPPLREEVKCMRGAEFRSSPPRWLVTDCERNRLQLELLAGRVPARLERYFAPLEPVEPRRSEVLPHQVAMLRHAWTRRGSILACEMGTQKTLAAIELCERAVAERGGECWYVSKPAVLDAVRLEFDKWAARVRPRWLSINGLRRFLEGYRGPAPTVVVFDEASCLKGKGPWYAAAQRVADAVREEGDGWVLLMTGTPAPLDPSDWHSLAEVACPGYLRESTKQALVRRLAVTEERDFGQGPFREVVSWKREEVERLGRRLEGLVFALYSRDCQSLPELVEEVVALEPSPAALRAARLLAEEAGSAGQALNLVRQLSDGFRYREGGADRCLTPKDAALREHLARNEEVGRTLVYAPYRESVDRCAEGCLAEGWNVLRRDGRGWRRLAPGKGKKSKPTDLGSDGFEEWLLCLDRTRDSGAVRPLAFVAHPASGGYGLNLTAAREAACFSCDFDWGSHEQMKKRGHRPGMDLDRGFRVRYFCHLPTDRYVLANHEAKRSMQAWTLDEVRRALA